MAGHHAILVRSRAEATLAAVCATVTDVAETVPFAREKLGIDDARELTILCARRPSAPGARLVLVTTGEITHEAQNALLKLLEEPPETTRLILAVDPHLPLLPTLRSRLSEAVVPIEESTDPGAFSRLCALPVADRLAEIDRRLKAKDAAWVSEVAAELRRVPAATRAPVLPTQIHALVARFLGARGASNKQLLELAALSVAAPPTHRLA